MFLISYFLVMIDKFIYKRELDKVGLMTLPITP